VKPGKWTVFTIASVLLVGSASCAFMIWRDDFGVWRNPARRQLAVYYNDGPAKVLLNQRYVPENFDTLLLGPSYGVNWEMKTIGRDLDLRIYNESLEGGNASEEKLLVDRALPRGHFRIALIVLAPGMTTSHAYHQGMEQTKITESLGSVGSYFQAALAIAKAHHLSDSSKLDSYPDGSHAMRNPKGFEIKAAAKLEMDPIATHDLQNMVAELQRNNVQLIYIIPPVYQPFFAINEAVYRSAFNSMKELVPPAPCIDFSGPDDIGFRSDAANFIDDFHLTAGGAHRLSIQINNRLAGILSR